MSDQPESSHAELPVIEKPPDYYDDKFRAALPDLWKWFERVFPRQEQPGRAALILALIRCFSKKEILLRPKARNPAFPLLTEQVERERLNFHELLVVAPGQQLEAEISELLDYLTPPITDQQRETGKVAFSAQLSESGLGDKQIAEILKIVSRKRHGRPPERLASLRAWDLRLLGHRWKDITSKVCPCTKGEHDEYCLQSLRQGMMRLQKVADQYKVTEYAQDLARRARRDSKYRARGSES